MAAFFTAASTQYLSNAASPVTAYPFSVGGWIRLTAAANATRTIFGFSDTGTTNNYLLVRMTTTETVGVVSAAGGAETISSVLTALTAGTWSYVVARFIGATSRRISVLLSTGASVHNQGTTSSTPAGIDTQTIGATLTSGGAASPWDGLVGEYWLANGDIEPGDLQLQHSTLLQLAYGGPFSIPSIADDILEYRSFRVGQVSDKDDLNEVFHGANGRQTWTNTNSVTTAWHPPLPYWYIKPGQTQRVLTI